MFRVVTVNMRLDLDEEKGVNNIVGSMFCDFDTKKEANRHYKQEKKLWKKYDNSNERIVSTRLVKKLY